MSIVTNRTTIYKQVDYEDIGSESEEFVLTHTEPDEDIPLALTNKSIGLDIELSYGDAEWLLHALADVFATDIELVRR